MDVQQNIGRIQASSETDIAWAAGFFDGEGSSGSNGKSLWMTIGQVNRDNLTRFLTIVGKGSVTGPYQKATNRRPIYTWRAYADDAFAVFRKLEKFLGIEKQDQFLHGAIRFCHRTVQHRKGNPTCSRGHEIAKVGRYTDHDCNECRRLRRSGIIMPPKIALPTAFSLRLHGIREYHPEVET